MNVIPIIAHGSPGSFVRHVQHNPEIVINMARALRKCRFWFQTVSSDMPIKLLQEIDAAMEPLRKFVPPADASGN